MQPQLFGKYILLERLAAGGMGEVFLAKSGPKGFERYFAIKRILTKHDGAEEFVTMLMDEAKISIGLVHPNIVQVFEFGELDGSFFLAMEYVEGLSLSRILSASARQGLRLPYGDCISVAMQICRALDYAHDRNDGAGDPLNIIHRDISPQNILVDYSGSAKLIDFGIAKAASNLNQTEIGTIKGKIAYMAPEHARGEKIDRRADICSVGIILWECLTYTRMFAGETAVRQLNRVQTGEFPDMKRSLDESIPDSVRDALERSLTVNPDDRYTTAGEMERDLSRARHELDNAYTSHGLARFVKQLDDEREVRSDRFKVYTDIHTGNVGVTAINAAMAVGKDPSTEVVEIDASKSAIDVGQGRKEEVTSQTEEIERKPAPASGVRWAPIAVVILALGLGAVIASLWAGKQNRTSQPAVLRPSLPAKQTQPAPGFLRPQAGVQTPPPVGSPAKKRNAHGRKRGKRGRKKQARRDVEVVESVAVAPTPAPVEMGCAAIAVEPWAHVYVKGKRVGTTPIPCLKLPVGTHELRLENPAIGASKKVKVKVRASGKTQLFEKLP